MNKIIENLKSGNYEVVDNQGVSVTKHFIECLEKELKNIIKPKFMIGDKCWAIRNATNIYNEPKQVLIKEITITKNCIKYYAKNGCLTNRTNKTTMHIQSQLFATKEEAQERLKNYEKL